MFRRSLLAVAVVALSLLCLVAAAGARQEEEEEEDVVANVLEDVEDDASASLPSSAAFDINDEGDDDDTQLLLETARGCHRKRHIPRCVSARNHAKRERAWCLKHYRSKSPRCHRLDALEKLLYGRSGTSRLARALVRRCAGEGLGKVEIERLRGILMRNYLSSSGGNKLLGILNRCAISKEQLGQLKRVLRIHTETENIRGINIKRRTLGEDLAHLQSEERAITGGKWLSRLRNYVGDAEDVKREWVKKMIKAAKAYDPCAHMECPADSECKHGYCWKIDLCKNVQCNDGFECVGGQCHEKSCKGVQCPSNQRCYRGGCVSKTSCLGIRCRPGLDCVKGKCLDLTRPESCATLKCPAGQTCVNIDDAHPSHGGRCITAPPRQDRDDNDKSVKHDGPPSWVGGQWSDCSMPCGQPGGYRTREVLCRYKDNAVAPTEECTGEKPTDTSDCVCSDDSDTDDEKAEPEPSDKCSRRCEGTKPCSGDDCDGKATVACGRPSCTVPDFHTIMRVCHGGAWTHCNCPAGYYPVTGGCDGTTWPHRWQYNNWNGGNGWLCGGHKGKKTVHVICAHGVGACRWQTTDGGDWHRQLCPKNTDVLSGGCNAIGKPHILRWQMKSGNGWLCGGWNGAKRTSVLCCDAKSMRPGCKTFTRRFGDWGHITCPKGTKLVSGGCDADKPFLIRSSRPINRTTWQCGGWGGNKLITVTCCTDHNDF